MVLNMRMDSEISVQILRNPGGRHPLTTPSRAPSRPCHTATGTWASTSCISSPPEAQPHVTALRLPHSTLPLVFSLAPPCRTSQTHVSARQSSQYIDKGWQP